MQYDQCCPPSTRLLFDIIFGPHAKSSSDLNKIWNSMNNTKNEAVIEEARVMRDILQMLKGS